MAVTAPSIASLVQFSPGQLGVGIIGAAAPTGAGQFPLPPDGKPPSFDLAANGSGAIVGFQQGGLLPGGAGIVPALVLWAGGSGGLLVKLLAFFGDGSKALIANVPHVSTSPASGVSWQWSAQSGGSNS